MVRVFLFLAAVELALVVLALISCLSAERRAIRTMRRAFWILTILLLPILGPVLWFVAGRPTGQAGAGGSVGRTPPRPNSPDDDPDFLRNLDADRSRRDRELFEGWEEDLRRREDERREQERRGDEPRPDEELRHPHNTGDTPES